MSNNKNNDDFFGDILDDDEDNSFGEETQDEETEFDFEDDVFDLPEEEPEQPKIKKVTKVNENYTRTKSDIQENVEELKGSIESMLETIDIKPEDMFPDKDLLPGLDIEIEHHDYEKDIELIKIESKETLECLANLYLSEDQMKTRNIYKIIKDDSISLAKLNFSIEQAQRALISCMKQLDMGVNDPDMYQAVAMFQKEMRDTIKLTYELQRKMKDFYKELKAELQEINAGEEEIIEDDDEQVTIIGDPKMLNELFDKMQNDPTLLEEMMNNQKKKKKKK